MDKQNKKILETLIKTKNYRLIKPTDIIDDSNFSFKQYESIYLATYRNFMSAFLPQDSIHIRLLNHQDINGVAFLVDKNYYSLIHWGTIYNLHKYALHLTEDSCFFPNISSTNGNWEILSEDDISEEQRKQETFYKKIYPFGTTDQHRRDLAFIIGSIACFSTIFHEAGHILNGHLDYMEQTFQESYLPILFNNTELRNNITRKTLEKDADEFSSNRIIDYAFALNKDLFFKDYSYIIKDENTLIEIIITAITLKFLLFGINPYVYNPCYLPNAYRIVNIADSAFQHLHAMKYSSISKQTFHEIAQKSILNVVNSYNSIFSTQISPNNLLSQMEQGQTENQLLMMEWNKIYPILNNYKKENIHLPEPFKNI